MRTYADGSMMIGHPFIRNGDGQTGPEVHYYCDGCATGLYGEIPDMLYGVTHQATCFHCGSSMVDPWVILMDGKTQVCRQCFPEGLLEEALDRLHYTPPRDQSPEAFFRAHMKNDTQRTIKEVALKEANTLFLELA
jgi:hypothetical protein